MSKDMRSSASGSQRSKGLRLLPPGIFWDSPTHHSVALDKQFEPLGESTFSPFEFGFLRPLSHID